MSAAPIDFTSMNFKISRLDQLANFGEVRVSCALPPQQERHLAPPPGHERFHRYHHHTTTVAVAPPGARAEQDLDSLRVPGRPEKKIGAPPGINWMVRPHSSPLSLCSCFFLFLLLRLRTFNPKLTTLLSYSSSLSLLPAPPSIISSTRASPFPPTRAGKSYRLGREGRSAGEQGFDDRRGAGVA
jgi:hypothetical protein